MTTTDLDLPAEVESSAGGASQWRATVARLNRLSVERHFDAYGDVDWDAPEMAIDWRDPRWCLTDDHPLGRTEWYRSLPAETRSRLGLHDVVSKMKLGWQFENVLERGLLEFVTTVDDDSPELRYAYHEVIEESQHTLMFQEFVRRAQLPAAGMPWPVRVAARRIVTLGRVFPAAFFVFVLGGEDPIDAVQRRALRAGGAHPLGERIMRIHVTEEARHLSFARAYLRRVVPSLPRHRRIALSIQAPITLGAMAGMMLRPSPQLVREYGIPRDVVDAAYGDDRAVADMHDSLRKVRALCVELGLVNRLTRRLWRAFGIWPDDDAAPGRQAERSSGTTGSTSASSTSVTA